jgi:hypothetical protein
MIRYRVQLRGKYASIWSYYQIFSYKKKQHKPPSKKNKLGKTQSPRIGKACAVHIFHTLSSALGSTPADGTLGSYLRDAFQEGSSDAGACLPVPRALGFSCFLLFAWWLIMLLFSSFFFLLGGLHCFFLYDSFTISMQLTK